MGPTFISDFIDVSKMLHVYGEKKFVAHVFFSLRSSVQLRCDSCVTRQNGTRHLCLGEDASIEFPASMNSSFCRFLRSEIFESRKLTVIEKHCHSHAIGQHAGYYPITHSRDHPPPGRLRRRSLYHCSPFVQIQLDQYC